MTRPKRDVPEETIECLICGRSMQALGSHLRRWHDLTAKQYRAQFPGAPTITEALRTIRSETMRDLLRDARCCPVNGVPDDPRHWTRERIIAAICRWTARRGFPPTAAEWQQRSRERGGGLIEVVRMWPSVSTVIDEFGSWAAGLEAAGTVREAQRPPGRRAKCMRGHRFTPENTIFFPDGRRRCRTCEREEKRAYREKNREKVRAYHRAYREKNREKNRERYREYNKTEKARERDRRYREKNREKIRERSRENMRARRAATAAAREGGR